MDSWVRGFVEPKEIKHMISTEGDESWTDASLQPYLQGKVGCLVLYTNLCLALVKAPALAGEITSKMYTPDPSKEEEGGLCQNKFVPFPERLGRKGALLCPKFTDL